MTMKSLWPFKKRFTVQMLPFCPDVWMFCGKYYNSKIHDIKRKLSEMCSLVTPLHLREIIVKI